MLNPFRDLSGPKLDNPKGEEVSGSFACAERGCFKVSTTAKYLDEARLLTWLCPDGHTNSVKDFHID